MKKLTKISSLLLMTLSLFAFVGCDDNNMEDAADNLGDAAEDVGDSIKDATN